MESTIKCPNCAYQIEITEVMSAQLAEKMRAEVTEEMAPLRKKLEQAQGELARREAKLADTEKAVTEQVQARLAEQEKKLLARARQQAVDELTVDLKDRDEQIKEMQLKLSAANNKEVDLRKRERELTDQQEQMKAEREQVEEAGRRAAQAERDRITAEATQKAREQLAGDLAAQRESMAAMEEQLKAARQAEKELLQREMKLKDREEAVGLETQRQVSALRDQLVADTRKQAAEEYGLKEAEHNKRLADLKAQLDDARRKADQGSQQMQGEVMELALQQLLTESFPADSIEEVPKGVRGGDVVQRVRTGGGLDCGTILWESKRTKNWSSQWPAKLREDQRNAKAELAILVSEVLPDGVEYYQQQEGIWVCSWSMAVYLAAALRNGLLETAKARHALEGRQTKMEQVYSYLAGAEFKNRVGGFIEPIVGMKTQLDQEKRALTKHWASREKMLDQAITGIAGMYGDFQGIIGGTLPQIEAMELLRLDGETV